MDAQQGLSDMSMDRDRSIDGQPAQRTLWGWVTIIGLALLAAGVALLVVFALRVA